MSPCKERKREGEKGGSEKEEEEKEEG